MANKKVEFHEAASLELEAAFDWYRSRSESAAGRFVEEPDRAVARMAETPHRWSEGNHGTPKFVLQRFPFVVVYRELPSSIQVIAVAHGHRRPGDGKIAFDCGYEITPQRHVLAETQPFCCVASCVPRRERAARSRAACIPRLRRGVRSGRVFSRERRDSRHVRLGT